MTVARVLIGQGKQPRKRWPPSRVCAAGVGPDTLLPAAVVRCSQWPSRSPSCHCYHFCAQIVAERRRPRLVAATVPCLGFAAHSSAVDTFANLEHPDCEASAQPRRRIVYHDDHLDISSVANPAERDALAVLLAEDDAESQSA